MRAAVARHQGRSGLWIEAQSGFVELAPIANPASALATLRDVGDLLAAGHQAMTEAAEIVSSTKGVDLESLDLLAPVLNPHAFVCVGRNYLEHIKEEGKAPIPPYPYLFSKFSNALNGHRQPVRHHLTQSLDYEGELAVIIGRTASRVTAGEAMDFVGGYTILNDVSGRDLQSQDQQWIRGKSLDTWAPLGPVFVSAEEIPDPYSLRIQTRVNGELRQDAPVSDMIFKIPELISFITQGITLQPGDLIATGTPSGVGLGFDPPKWLQVGDRIDITIDPIGTLSNTVGSL
ncbi:MAG TPA: fumarylacetoacetate hydrolase family protein [Acidimicrobiia bacterium]|nr:fumarylacetoacetate hydrolase family protein [Acidimicrobiia bacterium]